MLIYLPDELRSLSIFDNSSARGLTVSPNEVIGEVSKPSDERRDNETRTYKSHAGG